MENKKYFAVTTKCGHVGRKYYLPVTFPVVAESGKEAARLGRDIPRVKHTHKDAILDVREISYEEYLILENENDNNDNCNECACNGNNNCNNKSNCCCHNRNRCCNRKCRR